MKHAFTLHCDPCHGNCAACREANQVTPVEPAFWDFTPPEMLCGAIVIVVTIVASALV